MGRTSTRLALVGKGIEKSLAPAFHVAAGQLLGLDVSYELFPRTPEFANQLDAFLIELAGDGYHGVNVTVPFKATAWRSAVQPSAAVAAMGVANTLLLGPAGPTHAFNTDHTGFKWAYRRQFGTTSPGSIALLGAGGVGTSTATALIELGASAVRVFDIVPETVAFPGQPATGEEWVNRRVCRYLRRGRQSTGSTESSMPPRSGCTFNRGRPSNSRPSDRSNGCSTPSIRRSTPS